MTYFTSITTTANIPHFEKAGQNHANALNNYMAFGVSAEANPMVFAAANTTRPRTNIEVESSSTSVNVSNGVIYTTTTLCCETGGESEEYQK